MKIILLIAYFVFSCSGTIVVQEATDQQGAAAAIRSRFEMGREAWNRGDLAGYLAGYWDSEKTRWASGTTVVRGRKTIDATFKTRFPSPVQMGKIDVSDLEIEVLSESDALVFGQLVHSVGNNSRKGSFTVHLRKIGGVWLVVSDHFSAGV